MMDIVILRVLFIVNMKEKLPPKKTDPLRSEMINNVAYLRVPQEIIPWEEALTFAQDVRSALIALDSQNPSGWVIDLRASYGGGMWASLVALWPLLPNQECAGYFLSPNQDPQPWGPIEHESQGVCSLEPYTLKNKNPALAVLTGKNTNSAGEAITIAFRGIKNVKSFGHDTQGSSTGNGQFYLLDQRKIALNTSIMADRNQTPYGGKISPDVPFQGNYDHLFDGRLLEDYNLSQDTLVQKAMECVQKAMEWIQNPDVKLTATAQLRKLEL